MFRFLYHATDVGNLNIYVPSNDSESFIESIIKRFWKFYKKLLKVLSSSSNSSKESDEVDRGIGEDGQVLPQLEGGGWGWSFVNHEEEDDLEEDADNEDDDLENVMVTGLNSTQLGGW